MLILFIIWLIFALAIVPNNELTLSIMKQEFNLDLESFHIMEMVIELSGMTDSQFINLCIHHYGESLKSAFAFIATNGHLPDVEVDNDSKLD